MQPLYLAPFTVSAEGYYARLDWGAVVLTRRFQTPRLAADYATAFHEELVTLTPDNRERAAHLFLDDALRANRRFPHWGTDGNGATTGDTP